MEKIMELDFVATCVYCENILLGVTKIATGERVEKLRLYCKHQKVCEKYKAGDN